MKRVWLLAPADEVRSVVAQVSALALLHPEPLPTPDGDIAAVLRRGEAQDTSGLESRLGKLRQILDVFDSLAPLRRSFAANFVSLPLEVSREEYDRAIAETDVEDLARRAQEVNSRHEDLLRRRAEVEEERERLAPWAGAAVGAPPTLKHCTAWLGTVSSRTWARLSGDAEMREILALRLVLEAGGRALVAAVALVEDTPAAAEALRRAGFEPLQLPPGTASIGERLAALERESADLLQETEVVREEAADLAAKYRRAVTICLADLEMAYDAAISLRGALLSGRIGIVSGYARATDVPALRRAMESLASPVSVAAHDPTADEAVPVSIRTPPAFAPARFLTRLFGVPDYFGFDPSPFILLTFLIFFGFCFGDAIYGLVIFLLARWIAHRVRGYPNLRDFFTLIAWGGISSIIVGVVTGAWMADLFDPARGLVGEGSIFVRLRSALMIRALDPMTQPVRVLLVALFIGILNQFYGIVLRMYRDARKGDYAAAVFDGGLWLLFLPGLVIVIAGAMAGVPGWLGALGLVLLITGAAGLVLTQGRREKGLFAKALTGLVSLYGILGTYGTTSFIGDTLSYSRLLALGLTTTIVGMSFNIVAGLLKGVPVAGIVLVMVVLLVGHVFNILISILGAFVHSGRLVFVEFFGRFYEVGGKRFQPLGTSDRVRVVDAAASHRP